MYALYQKYETVHRKFYATENHSSLLIPASSKIVSSKEGSISSP